MMKKITRIAALLAATAMLFGAIGCYSGTSGEWNRDSNNGAGQPSGGNAGETGGEHSTGSWDFEKRSAAPAGANAWDASIALTSDVELTADSGTGKFVVLTGVKAKYNNGLQFSNGSSAKNLFNITGEGSVSITYNAPADATDAKPFFLYADGDETHKVTASSGKPTGTYTVTISGETKFYSNDCRILTVKFN
ncbi:MAG: hypothetical protein K2N31_05965 [Treponemataceae bacterium]|nr:hypothetical protein [Treponemataceae bacterium]